MDTMKQVAGDPPVAASYRFVVLLLVVVVAGISQGLLLPLLSILLERSGVSADLNGVHSTALYIGTFGAMFFAEKPVARFGYKPVILTGMTMVLLGMLLFPVGTSLAMWFVLRIVVGVGDSFLHYATQLWIVSTSPADRRGRMISLYGMSYGIGFSLGPLGINLLSLGQAAPFLINALLFIRHLERQNRPQAGVDGVRPDRIHRLLRYPSGGRPCGGAVRVVRLGGGIGRFLLLPRFGLRRRYPSPADSAHGECDCIYSLQHRQRSRSGHRRIRDPLCFGVQPVSVFRIGVRAVRAPRLPVPAGC